MVLGFSLRGPKVALSQCQAVPLPQEGPGRRTGRGRKQGSFLSLLFQNSCPPTSELVGSPNRLFWEPMKVHDIRWNFEKFLVGPDGVPIMRWHHRTTINNVKMDILTYMRQKAAQEAKK